LKALDICLAEGSEADLQHPHGVAVGLIAAQAVAAALGQPEFRADLGAQFLAVEVHHHALVQGHPQLVAMGVALQAEALARIAGQALHRAAPV